MKVFFISFSLLLFVLGCKRREQSADIPKRLKAAMAEFLKKKTGPDTAQVKFDIEDVVYFEDAKYFVCEFKVHMVKTGVKDTTGEMRANIAKDFSSVTRTW